MGWMGYLLARDGNLRINPVSHHPACTYFELIEKENAHAVRQRKFHRATGALPSRSCAVPSGSAALLMIFTDNILSAASSLRLQQRQMPILIRQLVRKANQ